MMSRDEIETALRDAEAQAAAARVRHELAERRLWALVSRSGREPVEAQEVNAARFEAVSADRSAADARALVEELTQLLQQATAHESRLMSIADHGVAWRHASADRPADDRPRRWPSPFRRR